MIYFRIVLYNLIAAGCVFAMITTTLVQGKLVFDDPDLWTKVGRIIIHILIPNLIYLCTIAFSRDWMRRFINSKLTYQAKGNGINVDNKYDNGMIEQAWFEALPRLTNEDALKSWSDNWLSGHFDDLGIRFWIDDIAYSSRIYKEADRSKIDKSFSLPDRALIIEYNDADVFGDDWVVWMNNYLSEKANKLTNYQTYHKLKVGSDYKGTLFFKEQQLIGDASLLQTQLEANINEIVSTKLIMFKRNIMILYADNPGNLVLNLPLFLTPTSYRIAVGHQQANIYKMCQLLVSLSALN